MFKNKRLEIETYSDNKYEWFDLSVQWTRNQDHAGLRFSGALWKYSFDMHFYDIRHWDEYKNQWKTYPENKDEIAQEKAEDEHYDNLHIQKLIRYSTRRTR